MTNEELKSMPFAAVHWRDAMGSDGWVSSIADDYDNVHVSVGKMKELEDTYLIISHYSTLDRPSQYFKYMRIPKSCVIKVERMKTVSCRKVKK